MKCLFLLGKTMESTGSQVATCMPEVIYLGMFARLAILTGMQLQWLSTGVFQTHSDCAGGPHLVFY